MRSSNPVLEPRLAWALCQGLEQLNALLWDRYGEDFLKLAEEEDLAGAKGSEEDLEIPF